MAGVAVVDINAGERVTGVFMDDNSTIEVEAVSPEFVRSTPAAATVTVTWDHIFADGFDG